MLAAGARAVMIDRDEAALVALCNKHGDLVVPLVIDLLDPQDCATPLPKVLEKVG
jgi:ribitol 2-dehydrogenase